LTRSAAGETAENGLRRGGLEGLFNPKSIAMIGASSDPRKISGRPIQYLKTTGFAGPIYPINPQHKEVQGLPAYPSLADVPGDVDLALIGLPASAVAEAVEACIRKKVRSIIVFSAGFGEVGDKGRRTEEQLARRCIDGGVRLLGPNCLGLASFVSGAYATFSHSLEFAPPAVGRVAVVSQSGAVGTYALVKGVARGIRFSRFVATGNEADVDVADCIAWLAGDPATGVIVGYLESCRDGRRLADALERARVAGKPVVLLKGGASEVGSLAAASHTGALAGSDAVYDAVFAATGAARARSIDELLDIAYACSQPVLPAGRRLGVVTVSGGFGVMMADAAARTGVELPKLPASVQAKIKSTLAFASATNPVDVTPQLLNDFSLLPPVLDARLADGHFDAIVAFFGTMGLDPHLIGPLKSAMAEAKQRHPKQLFALCMMSAPESRKALEAEGIMVFEDPERVVAAVTRLAAFREAFARPAPIRAPLPCAGQPPLRGPISEVGAKRLLAAAGVPFAPERIVASREQAVAAALKFGGPVALKVAAMGVAHKSDVGGVVLGLTDPGEIATAYRSILASVRTAFPDAEIDGVSVAPMIGGGVETVIGARNDPDFGPVVMFGLGGIHVEVLKDVTFRLAPVHEAEALEMIRAVNGLPLLAGARGRPAVDLAALARSIAAVSRFAAAHAATVESIDVNPFIALPEGGTAVDALIVTRADANEPVAPRKRVDA
jgi:acyl-CoA synthetase (NDP forming)